MNYRRIRDARKALKMTQAEVAQRTGINRATLSKYETGEITPSLGQLEKLAQILNFYISEVVAPDEWAKIDSSDAFSDKGPEVNNLIQTRVHSPNLQLLSDALDHLNDEGQEKLVDYADDLVSSGKYKKQGADEVGQEET